MAAGGGPKDGNGGSATERTVASPCERLDYIADMVLELKMMSAEANYQALARLLELAFREAVQRRRTGKDGEKPAECLESKLSQSS